MVPATSGALVGGGVLSVLVCPLVAVGLHRSAPLTPADVGIPAAEFATGTNAAPDSLASPAKATRARPLS